MSLRRGGRAVMRAVATAAAPSPRQLVDRSTAGTHWSPPLRHRWFTASTSAARSAEEALAPPSAESATGVRNFAIIAHVDHGKTTLLDTLMSQGGQKASERLMDNNALEKERGITISSKYTSFPWRSCTLNAVDTPGHADFGGEVERVLDMVDGCLLLVDATEGPMAQTKFVLSKALQKGLRPIVVMNKVDRDGVTADGCAEVESKLFDLFASMGADDEQLDFATVYASARGRRQSRPRGRAPRVRRGRRRHVASPRCPPRARPFPTRISRGAVQDAGVDDRARRFRGATRDGSRGERKGQGWRSDQGVAARRRRRTRIRSGDEDVHVARRRPIAAGQRVRGRHRVRGGSHDGDGDGHVGGARGERTSVGESNRSPTLKMTFGVNDSRLGGREGKQLTGRNIWDRLTAEAETNVALRVLQQPGGGGDRFEVQGRGELHLGVLIETMRREKFELSVSPPAVLFKDDPDRPGKKLEPLEEVVAEVEEEHVGGVIEALSLRKGELVDMVHGAGEGGKTRLEFLCPSRGLIGFRAAFVNETRGTGTMHRAFHSYGEYRGSADRVRKGAIISSATGVTTTYALGQLEARGTLFVGPKTEVYEGMIIGENSREETLEVNPCKEKKLTNMRASGNDETVRLTPPKVMTLEEAIGYVQEDELIEVTPGAVRLRKAELDAGKRKSNARKASKE